MSRETPFRVLIVDDSPTMRAVCTELLTHAGLRCAAAAGAEAGYRLLQEAQAAGEPFEGLLLDWLMPGMNGWELLERIGADRRFDALAVMIFTEQPDDRAYQLASQRPNNDIQLKEDLTLLPYRMRKFLTTYSEAGGMGDWRARQLLKSREPLGGSILFVDDSPTVCAKYGDLLRNNGYTVLIADSMGSALEQARRHKPQLAVVDYFMPGGNGDALCRALLDDDRTRDITVVMHSQRKEMIEDALDAGAIDLIWKDDPINIFLMRVASIMRTLRANRQAKDLDILFAATQALDIGVMSATADGFRAFNDTMDRFARECGGLPRFDPATVTALPQRINDRHGRRRAFNIQTVDGGGGERVVLVQDVTDSADQAEVLAAARDRAVELADAKSQFLASMSHEIRTPLNGVLGMLDLLKGTALDETQHRFVDTSIASGETLLAVVGDILDFSKIDAGRLELEVTPFHLPDLAEEAMQMLASRATAKGLEPICCVEPEVPTSVVGDPTRLRQILANLIGNAVKFTAQGEVGLRVWLDEPAGECDPPLICFAVCDTGIGIDPRDRAHIFEAFRQADNSTTRRFGGTGLGLAISSQLVQMMGGTLDVESAPGRGSSFTFSIPLPLPEGGIAAPPWRMADVAVLAGRRVLIVDDNATNRLYLTQLCQAWAMRVSEAADGAAALVAIAAAEPAFDLILLDRMMPGVDGVTVLRQVRADPRWLDLRIVLQSSMDEPGEFRQARALGADDVLVKPIRRQALLESLSHLFGGGHADPREVHRAPPGVRLDGCRVLAVEDNEVNQMVLDGILARAGCAVTVANNGAEALDTLSAQRFDVVLMDCEMPVLDGLTATRRLREREGANGAWHQPVVALTAHAFPAERDRCLAAGMDDYLAKPIRAPTLLATLSRWWARETAPDHPTPDHPTPDHPTADHLAADQPTSPAAGRAGDPDASATTAPAPTPAAADERPALDPALLAMLRDAIGDLQPVFAVARDSLPGRLVALRRAVANGDAAAMRGEAHTLAGSCGNLGATEVGRLARAMETAARDGDLATCATLFPALEREFGRMMAAIEAQLASQADAGIDGGIATRIDVGADRRAAAAIG